MTDRGPTEQPPPPEPTRIPRRAFLGGGAALALGGAATALVGCSSSGGAGTDGDRAGGTTVEHRYVDFHGEHQAGITERNGSFAVAAAFRTLADDRDELVETFRALTEQSQALMAGDPPPARDRAYPPTDSGILGPEPPPAELTVITSVGASLFDDRYGLADRTPRELVEMPFFANDRLEPDQTHGDVLLTIDSERPDVTLFALRQLMRATRDTLVLRWMVEGFNRRPAAPAEPGRADVRNLLGFKDGSANLDVADAGLMDRHVWVGPDDDEPAWAEGGSYHVVRTIRMFVEPWDRTRLSEQEAIIGRAKASGAPLDGTDETDVPRYDDDPDGEVVPLDAHIRLANPRTPATEDDLILRRGFSFSRGFDDAGQLDQGLCFVCFQRSLERGFVAVQHRLDGEPLEEYIRPVGGGFFFALPGVPGPDRFLGDRLLT